MSCLAGSVMDWHQGSGDREARPRTKRCQFLCKAVVKCARHWDVKCFTYCTSMNPAKEEPELLWVPSNFIVCWNLLACFWFYIWGKWGAVVEIIMLALVISLLDTVEPSLWLFSFSPPGTLSPPLVLLFGIPGTTAGPVQMLDVNIHFYYCV